MTATPTPTIIDPEKYACVLTTSLNRLRKMGACADSYRKLVAHLGGTKFDHDAPINLLTILESNGTEDCLWALCATEQNCDVVARLMAADFAEAVLPVFERERPGDMRPRQAIAVARAFAISEADAAAGAAAGAAARDAAWAAAWAAAEDAAWAAAGDAAWDAARDAARDAAGDAARAAAWAAAGDAAGAAAGAAAWAAARDAAWAAAGAAAGAHQSIIIRRYLKRGRD